MASATVGVQPSKASVATDRAEGGQRIEVAERGAVGHPRPAGDLPQGEALQPVLVEVGAGRRHEQLPRRRAGHVDSVYQDVDTVNLVASSRGRRPRHRPPGRRRADPHRPGVPGPRLLLRHRPRHRPRAARPAAGGGATAFFALPEDGEGRDRHGPGRAGLAGLVPARRRADQRRPRPQGGDLLRRRGAGRTIPSRCTGPTSSPTARPSSGRRCWPPSTPSPPSATA